MPTLTRNTNVPSTFTASVTNDDGTTTTIAGAGPWTTLTARQTALLALVRVNIDGAHHTLGTSA